MRNNTPNYIGALAVIAGTLLLLIYANAVKFSPLFLHRTVYYCQEVLRTVRIQLIPGYLSTLLVAGVVTAAGFIAVRILLTAVQYVLFSRSLRQKRGTMPAWLIPVLQQHRLRRQTVIIREDRPLAFCFGLIRPRMYLTTGMLQLLNRRELGTVILHEKHHLDQHDTLLSLLTSVIQYCFPFFPLVTDIVNRYRLEREILADSAAIRATRTGKRQVLSVLRKLLEQEVRPLSVLAPAMGANDTLELRIVTLLEGRTPLMRIAPQHLLFSLITCTVLLLLTLTPVHAEELHNPESGSILMCVSGSECTQLCRETTSQLPVAPHSAGLQDQFTPAFFSRD